MMQWGMQVFFMIFINLFINPLLIIITNVQILFQILLHTFPDILRSRPCGFYIKSCFFCNLKQIVDSRIDSVSIYSCRMLSVQ